MVVRRPMKPVDFPPKHRISEGRAAVKEILEVLGCRGVEMLFAPPSRPFSLRIVCHSVQHFSQWQEFNLSTRSDYGE